MTANFLNTNTAKPTTLIIHQNQQLMAITHQGEAVFFYIEENNNGKISIHNSRYHITAIPTVEFEQPPKKKPTILPHPISPEKEE